jgi:hypothetical protein
MQSIVRLYKHSDGYPTDVFANIIQTTESAECYIRNNASLLTVFREDGQCPGLDEMPSGGFAAQLIAAGNTWDGSAYRFDDADPTPAIDTGPLRDDHFGNHGDLEWVYLIDVKSRLVTIWGGRYGATQEHFARGPTDPRKYADALGVDYREQERATIAAHLVTLRAAGWRVNPTAKTIRRRKPCHQLTQSRQPDKM